VVGLQGSNWLVPRKFAWPQASPSGRLPSGAKYHLLSASYGTTEVVPQKETRLLAISSIQLGFCRPSGAGFVAQARPGRGTTARCTFHASWVGNAGGRLTQCPKNQPGRTATGCGHLRHVNTHLQQLIGRGRQPRAMRVPGLAVFSGDSVEKLRKYVLYATITN